MGDKPGPYVAERSYNLYARLGARIALLGIDARVEVCCLCLLRWKLGANGLCSVLDTKSTILRRMKRSSADFGQSLKLPQRRESRSGI